MRPGLSTMRAMLDALGNPQDSLKFVHVAGTNGKGAVTAMLDAVLRAAGYRVCRYTSPHLVSLAERFFVNGAPASSAELDACVVGGAGRGGGRGVSRRGGVRAREGP